MDLLRSRTIDSIADPHTDPRLLPVWMRREENAGEAACYRIALRMAMEHVLSPEQSRALHMRYWLGMSVAEIGRELGVSPSGATKRIAAALKLLREQVTFCVGVYRALALQEANPQ